MNKTVTVTLDTTPFADARRVRRLNGGNLGPPLVSEKAGRDLRATFAGMRLPFTRLHDAPLDNPGMRLVDIPQVFANFHADAADPRNYWFAQTDDYLRAILDAGTGVIYRLGTSIEHSRRKYFTAPPPDVAHWVDICSGIIRHYTEGWAGGFHWDIRYWEIWNEPEVTDAEGAHLMWAGTVAQYNAFYAAAATELKRRFPRLKIGGPAHVQYGPHTAPFIEHCAKNNAPLDFYSYHAYPRETAGGIIGHPAEIRALLDANNFKDTEIHLNEWHYFPGDWSRLRGGSPEARAETLRTFEEMRGPDAAAFLCSLLSLWQDTPLDMACYYTVTAGRWGLYDPGTFQPSKAWHGMAAFGKAAANEPLRLPAVTDANGVAALAGLEKDGRAWLLVSVFKCGPVSLRIPVTGAFAKRKISARLVDAAHDLGEIPAACHDGNIMVELPHPSAVLLLEWE